MKGARDYTDYVVDMLENAQKAREFVAGIGYKKFVADEKRQYAVVRALEVLGKAGRKCRRNGGRYVLISRGVRLRG